LGWLTRHPSLHLISLPPILTIFPLRLADSLEQTLMTGFNLPSSHARLLRCQVLLASPHLTNAERTDVDSISAHTDQQAKALHATPVMIAVKAAWKVL
jgi:hypothetical protein